MKLNIFARTIIGMGALCVTAPVLAVEAWSGQEGAGPYEVIYNSGVYTNAWWVAKTDCPGNETDTNPWKYERAATSAEISQYGNPTTCETSGGDVSYPEYNSANSYNANDVVSYNGATWKTSVAQSPYGFKPGEGNPWELYAEVPQWSAATTYNKGDKVQKGGQEYEALFYTVGDDPSNPANQNPTGTNGRPWKPLGQVVSYTTEQLNNAPQFNASTLYDSGTLIRYNGGNYVSQAKVQKVSPSDTNPWSVYIDWSGTKAMVGTPSAPWPAHVYAPYVDYTLNSLPDLASLAKNQKVTHFTMAFVVAKDADTCLPTWGTAYNINDYAQYSKIKALREAGGDVMVSIGGANNSPLAASCKNVSDLQKHYYDIVENLNLNVLDFDIEGTWVADHDSINRRNEAVKAVQSQWKAEGRSVGIWYTLPILPTGLTAEGLYVLEDAKAKGVELAGVNVMAMDYGNSICQSDGTEGQNIHGKCATSAIENLFSQLKQIFTDKSDADINAMMGVTPMNGYNDVQGEVFYLSDARLVMDDAKARDLGMIGMWSMMRDQPGVAGQVSPEHSGLTESQAPQYAFSDVFAPFTHTEASVDTEIKDISVNKATKDPQLQWTQNTASINSGEYTVTLQHEGWNRDAVGEPYYFGKYGSEGVARAFITDAGNGYSTVKLQILSTEITEGHVVQVKDARGNVVLTYQYTLEDVSAGTPGQILSSETSLDSDALTYSALTDFLLSASYQYVNLYYDHREANGKVTTTLCGSWFHGALKKSGKTCSTLARNRGANWNVWERIPRKNVKAGDKVYIATADGSTENAKILTVLNSITLTDAMLK
ncbi:glycosyl hydrolase family 18 protein [Enterobacter sichuanensis]|uniref:Lysozyme n=1 Tax=Enterobacter sichuanensis TaxID=2071710 RepID=A0ABS6G855_9ENTR|nr:glycosyl hydrolase family 18 protein [Enterobacter sichuanensis]MBU5922854.1 lysozyme [Enterobacter sichuanensis]OZV03155.1 lysozyme [Enterobacter cloacae]PAO17616.1 lysozyme [Enterobacter cloacae]